MEKYRASELWAELHALVVIGAEVFMTVLELSLIYILMIRPQYQKIFRHRAIGTTSRDIGTTSRD